MRTTVETIDQLDMCKRNYIRRQLRRDFLGLNKIQRQVSKTTPVSSAQFIHSAMSDSSRPHGPQHSRLGHLRPNNHREEVQSRPSADNWIKALLSKALPTRTRPSFSHHQSLPSRSLLLCSFSSVRLCETLDGSPQMAAHQAPLSLGFSRQEHWSVLPFPSPVHKSEK